MSATPSPLKLKSYSIVPSKDCAFTNAAQKRMERIKNNFFIID